MVTWPNTVQSEPFLQIFTLDMESWSQVLSGREPCEMWGSGVVITSCVKEASLYWVRIKLKCRKKSWWSLERILETFQSLVSVSHFFLRSLICRDFPQLQKFVLKYLYLCLYSSCHMMSFRVTPKRSRIIFLPPVKSMKQHIDQCL